MRKRGEHDENSKGLETCKDMNKNEYRYLTSKMQQDKGKMSYYLEGEKTRKGKQPWFLAASNIKLLLQSHVQIIQVPKC